MPFPLHKRLPRFLGISFSRSSSSTVFSSTASPSPVRHAFSLLLCTNFLFFWFSPGLLATISPPRPFFLFSTQIILSSEETSFLRHRLLAFPDVNTLCRLKGRLLVPPVPGKFSLVASGSLIFRVTSRFRRVPSTLCPGAFAPRALSPAAEVFFLDEVSVLRNALIAFGRATPPSPRLTLRRAVLLSQPFPPMWLQDNKVRPALLFLLVKTDLDFRLSPFVLSPRSYYLTEPLFRPVLHREGDRVFPPLL